MADYVIKTVGIPGGHNLSCSSTSIEIAATTVNGKMGFTMPADKSLWYGKQVLICGWKKSAGSRYINPPDCTFSMYLPSDMQTSDESDNFELFGTFLKETNVLNPHIYICVAQGNNRITFENDGIYCRTINNGNYLSSDQIYLYYSLFDWLCVVT